MAKARAASRASLANLSYSESTATADMAKERELRRVAETKVKTLTDQIKRLEDRETALKVELSECQKDYSDIKDRFKSVEEENCRLRLESATTSQRKSHVERRSEQLDSRVKELERILASEKRDVVALKEQIENLSRQLSEQERKQLALEEQHSRTTSRLEDKLSASQQECVDLHAQLTSARNSDNRHKDKVSELENLVLTLEREVSKLEVQRSSPGPGKESGAVAQVQLLKEQLAASEKLLQATREELTTLKQESRKTNTALWKKEKELSDCDLDKRIALRELKEAEEKIVRLTESRKISYEAHLAEKKKLEDSLSEAKTQAERSDNAAQEIADRMVELETKLAEKEQLVQSRQSSEDKLNAEIDRCKNDIRKLKCELQYSESRRLRAEASIDKEREELKTTLRETRVKHEEAASLRVQLDERIRAVENLEMNNKMLQEACRMLEDQLSDLERLADLNENKCANLESEVTRLRGELESCRSSLQAAETRVVEQEQRAQDATRQHVDAEHYIHTLQTQLHNLQESLRDKESRHSDLEISEAVISAERDSLLRKLNSAGQRIKQLQEECSALLTSTHQLTADNMKLQHMLKESQEETAAAKEANEAAAAWWKTRETKADQTLRQQAKLIDFLQSKVEEASRKKKTLGDMLFGKHKEKETPSTPSSSTDVTRALLKERQANRELREELSRLKSQLPANSPLLKRSRTLKPEKKKPAATLASSPERGYDRYLRIIRDGAPGTERVSAKTEDGALVLRCRSGETLARLLASTPTHTTNLTQTDAQNAFTVRTMTAREEDSERVTVICESAVDRNYWLSHLASPGAGSHLAQGLGYAPAPILATDLFIPHCIVEVRAGVYAIGTDRGLYSYRAGHSAPAHIATPGLRTVQAIRVVHQASAVLFLGDGELCSAELRLFLSVLERKNGTELNMDQLDVSVQGRILFVEVMPRRYSAEKALVCLSTSRHLHLLSGDLTRVWRKLRTIELGAPPICTIFTPHTILVSADAIYEIDLQRYVVEEFLDVDVSALAKKSKVRAILPIKERSDDDETEFLICFEELGVFVDEFGRRTRPDDVKWSGKPTEWSYRKPYVFVVQTDRVELFRIDENSFKTPPCQCDSVSVGSGSSDFVPEKCTVKLQCPKILGDSNAPGSLLLKEGATNCSMIEIDGTRALRRIGVSVETLDSEYRDGVEALYPKIEREFENLKEIDLPLSQNINPRKSPSKRTRESRDADAMKEFELQMSLDVPDGNLNTTSSTDDSEIQSHFLADIRRRAKQIRSKVQNEKMKEDELRNILTAEMPAKYISRSKSVESVRSEVSMASKADTVSVDSERECHVVGRTTADICNDIFLKKQVRFDGK